MSRKNILMLAFKSRIRNLSCYFMSNMRIRNLTWFKGNNHMPGQAVPFLHYIIFSKFCSHSKFQIRSFRRTTIRRNQILLVGLIRIGDIIYSFLYCRFDAEDLNICHISFIIPFNSFISSGVTEPVALASLASWFTFTPILCISKTVSQGTSYQYLR